MANSNSASSLNGVPTPSTTPPPAIEAKRPVASPMKPVPFKADVAEGESPKALPTDPADKPKDAELLEPEAKDTKAPNQDEDKDDATKEREYDIYNEAVLACKLLPRPPFTSTGY